MCSVGVRASLVAQRVCLQCGDSGLIPWWERSLEKGKATHSSTLAWIIPWTEESGGLHFIGSQRVKHD